MSERPSWKRPPAPKPDEVVSARMKELESLGQEGSMSSRAMRRGGSGTPRSVIYSQKMAIPKKRKKR